MSKLQKPKKAELSKRTSNKNLLAGWGGEVVHERLASGVKLQFDSDDDCILRFMGFDDISELCNPPKEPGTAVILKFHDGLRIVNINRVFALEAVEFKPGTFYYLWNSGEVETKHNPMKDIVVLKLGVEGEVVACPERVSDSKEIALTEESMAMVNYTRLNYSLRRNMDDYTEQENK
jgi:hypothetical protein